MDGTIIKLTTPVEAFGESLSEIILREPTGKLFSRLGEPRIPVVNESAGSGYWVTRDEVITQYLEALVDIPDAAVKAVALQALSLPDVMSLRQALFDFFTAAAEKAAATRRPRLSSDTNS